MVTQHEDDIIFVSFFPSKFGKDSYVKPDFTHFLPNTFIVVYYIHTQPQIHHSVWLLINVGSWRCGKLVDGWENSSIDYLLQD